MAHLPHNDGSNRHSHNLSRLDWSCLVAGSLLIVALAACSPLAVSGQSDSKTDKTASPRDRDTEHFESVTIPDSLRKLNLTGKQDEQIKEIIHEYSRI